MGCRSGTGKKGAARRNKSLKGDVEVVVDAEASSETGSSKSIKVSELPWNLLLGDWTLYCTLLRETPPITTPGAEI